MLQALQKTILSIYTEYTQSTINDFIHRWNNTLKLHFSSSTNTAQYLIRGGIYFIELGTNIHSEQNKRRPCIILSNRRYNNGNTVVVLPITSSTKTKQGAIHIEYSITNGLKKGGYILVGQIRTIAKVRMQGYIGMIEDEYLTKIDEMIYNILCTKNLHHKDEDLVRPS